MNEENQDLIVEEKKTRGRPRKEENIEQIDNNINQVETGIIEQPKSNNTSILVFELIILLIMLGSMASFTFYISKLNKESNEIIEKKPASNVQLQYTETTDKIKEGIYMTDVSEVAENVMPAIVAITSKTLVSSGSYYPFYGNQSQYAEGAGSGIIVSKSDEELMILTNEHVVSGASELSVKFINNKSVDAKIKGSAKNNDVAIITVNLADLDEDTLNNIKIATLGDSSKLKVGNGVIAIGNALGYGQSVTTGVVSAVDRVVKVDNVSRKMIQIDAAINGGNSGGALINGAGEVVGVNSAKYSSSGSSSQASIEGMGFAIPISDISELITKLMNGEEINDSTGAVMGVSGYIITSEMSAAYGLPAGFYVTDVEENKGADKAKVEIGDIIIEIDGNKVTKQTDISDVLAVKKPGDKITVKIKHASGRTYKEKEVEITLS